LSGFSLQLFSVFIFLELKLLSLLNNYLEWENPEFTSDSNSWLFFWTIHSLFGSISNILRLFSVLIVFVSERKSLSKSCFGSQITEMRRHLNCWLFCETIDEMFGSLSTESIVFTSWVVSIEGKPVLSLLFGVVMIFQIPDFLKKDFFLNKWSIN
jgi:hypothetical protein